MIRVTIYPAENKEKFRKLRNSITNKTRRAHGNYYQEIINGEKQNLKTLWDIFGKVVNTKKVRNGKKIESYNTRTRKLLMTRTLQIPSMIFSVA